MFSNLAIRIRSFHTDEEGLEALQVVMIIAIAAMVMIACATVGKEAVAWMKEKWGTLKGTSISGGGDGPSNPLTQDELKGMLE